MSKAKFTQSGNVVTAEYDDAVFDKRGKQKPAPVTVRGWPFGKIYLTHGTEENGQAVAWA